MRNFRSRMVLAFVCLSFVACQTAPEDQRDEAPSSIVRAAYMFYTGGPGFAPAPLLAENTLRDLALGTSAEFLEKNRTWVARSDWRRDFKDLFDSVIRWKRETLEKGAGHIFRLSGEYRDRPNARENQFDSLSYVMLRLAAAMGHAAAKAELPNRRHPVDEPEVLARTWAREYSQAVNGNWRAQIYLAQEYLMGHASRYNVPKDTMKAYYWYLRAKPSAAKSLRYISDVPARLSPVERKRVDEWVATGFVPEP